MPPDEQDTYLAFDRRRYQKIMSYFEKDSVNEFMAGAVIMMAELGYI